MPSQETKGIVVLPSRSNGIEFLKLSAHDHRLSAVPSLPAAPLT